MTQAIAGNWDIFCRVVDNFGDAGVCWRLARQLAREHGFPVRLWIDDLRALAPLDAGLSSGASQQTARGVEVCAWAQDWKPVAPASVVIEAFGCGLPEAYLDAMAARSPAPAWINLEYLSAEPWVEGCHRLPSRHPRLPLTRHFFFPGFTPATGGLLREAGLFEARDRFRGDALAQASLWQRLGLRSAPQGRVVSLFCYPDAPLQDLSAQLSQGPVSAHVLVPQGALASAWARAVGAFPAAPGDIRPLGRSSWSVFPFLDQDDYDRLLWSCDLNFVRGEDSFVRAQWAAAAMVWQPYRQTEEAHLVKLEAFLARRRAGLATETARAMTDFSLAWSGRGNCQAAWPALAATLPELGREARAWADGLGRQADLARTLVDFVSRSDIMRGSPDS